MTQDEYDEVDAALDTLQLAFETIRRAIQKHDKHLYERWKAGGFIVSDNIVSDYPSIGQVVSLLQTDIDDDTVYEDDDGQENDEPEESPEA